MKNNLFPWNTDMGLFPIVLVDTVQAVVYLLNLWLNLLTIFNVCELFMYEYFNVENELFLFYFYHS